MHMNVHCTMELVQNPATVKVKKSASLAMVCLSCVCLEWNRGQAEVVVP